MHAGDFSCLNCLHLLRIENKLKYYRNVCKNCDYCYVEMPKEVNEILKYKHGEKSMKVSIIIYVDTESLLEKISMCHSKPENSSTTKINLHTTCGYSLFTHCTSDTTKNKLHYYRGKDFMKNLCKDLNKNATRIINFEKKEMIPLSIEENESCLEQEVCHICQKKNYF